MSMTWLIHMRNVTPLSVWWASSICMMPNFSQSDTITLSPPPRHAHTHSLSPTHSPKTFWTLSLTYTLSQDILHTLSHVHTFPRYSALAAWVGCGFTTKKGDSLFNIRDSSPITSNRRLVIWNERLVVWNKRLVTWHDEAEWQNKTRQQCWRAMQNESRYLKWRVQDSSFEITSPKDEVQMTSLLFEMTSLWYVFNWRVSYFKWPDSFIRVIWRTHIYGMSHSYVWHDSSICGTRTDSYVWHDMTCVCCVCVCVC